MATIDLEVKHHDNLYLSFELVSFSNEETEGDLRLEGPYLSVHVGKKSACILVTDLIEKLIEHLE